MEKIEELYLSIFGPGANATDLTRREFELRLQYETWRLIIEIKEMLQPTTLPPLADLRNPFAPLR